MSSSKWCQIHLGLNELIIIHYIMAGRAFVVAKEVFIMETVIF